MWEWSKQHLLTSRLVGKLFLLVATIFVAYFATTFISPQTALAAEAKWENNAIVYNDLKYSRTGEAEDNSPYGFAKDTIIFSHTQSDGTSVPTSHFITFPPGADLAQASTATLTSFRAPPGGTPTRIGSPQEITISGDYSETPQSRCSWPGGFGIGWIMCPISELLADTMDILFEVLSSFLVVRTVTSSTETPLYRVWEVVRNLSNIVFIIAFLVIIYSQVSTIGITNYGIKKILPRFIIAAILVNMSFWVCALAVDVSNMLGYSIHDTLESVRNSAVTGEHTDVISWKSLVELVLGGGAAVGGTIAALNAATAASWSIYLILPTLVGLLLAALVALAILAARQALIVLFIVISPLAFVAYIFPGTDKWFDRWRSSFLTILMVFPLFAIIFGASQIAGGIIIQMAQSLTMVIFGLAVQVAPVVLTPMLVKFSGGLIGRIANIANNPSKGLLDRTRKWSAERRAEDRARILAGHKSKTALFQNATRRRNDKLRNRAEYKKNHETRGDTRYWETDQGRAIEGERLRDGVDENRRKSRSAAAHAARMAGDTESEYTDYYRDTYRPRKRFESDSSYEERRKAYQDMFDKDTTAIHDAVVDTTAMNTQKDMADRKFTQDYANRMQTDETLRIKAAGIMGEVGVRSVLATAQINSSKFTADDAKNIEATIDFDTASNVNKVLKLFENATTDAERVAYTSILGKRGAPGAEKLREAVKIMDQRHQSGQITRDTLMDFKEMTLSQNGAIAGLGKDLEFWFTNASYADDHADPTLAGQIRSFEDISNDVSTWSNLSADAFSRMNIVNQMHGLKILAHKAPDKFRSFVAGVMSNPMAVNNLKESVREAMSNHGNADDKYWYNDPGGYNVPSPDELTEFEKHVFENQGGNVYQDSSNFKEREGFDRSAQEWEQRYSDEVLKTATYLGKAQATAEKYNKSFRNKPDADA